jgi:arsenate reductase (thioredoxin)
MRSVLAQACLLRIAPDRFRAYSCGVPGQVTAPHPAALRALADAQIAIDLPAPRDWTALLRQPLLPVRIVILLDPLSDVELPAWPGQPDTALWSYPDLAARGDSVTPAEALKVLHSLRGRLEILAALPLRGLDRGALRSDLRDLAHR